MERFAEAIQQSGVDVVPRVVVGSGKDEKGTPTSSSVMEGLLTMLLSEKIGEPVKTGRKEKPDLQTEKLRKEIMKSIYREPCEEPPTKEEKKK